MSDVASHPRKIIHCDCDCFYASIEMRDNPSLVGLPLAVGGSPKSRGVVATCNYEARKFGIHSAMASATARKLCPDLVIIKPDMDRYRAASQQIHAIFQQYTHIIEPLSLDEAFLDVTHSNNCGGSATRIAAEIRQTIKSEINITVSAGVAPNKFLAKIASDWNKPDGQFVITPDAALKFLDDLPVNKLHGVGKVTTDRLRKMNIRTCGDLRKLPITDLTEIYGSFGQRLYDLSRGIDNRQVQTDRVRKSASVETTFAEDLPDLDSCLNQLPALHKQLMKRLGSILESYVVTKQVVKIKFLDFVSTTVETGSTGTDIQLFEELLQQGFERGCRPVRLLGLGVRIAPRSDSQAGEFTESQPGIVDLSDNRSEKQQSPQLRLGLSKV